MFTCFNCFSNEAEIRNEVENKVNAGKKKRSMVVTKKHTNNPDAFQPPPPHTHPLGPLSGVFGYLSFA